MIRAFFISLLGSSLLLAFEAKVTKADVVVAVNELNQTHLKDSTFTLKAGDLVCFVDGDGIVSIQAQGYKKRLSKRTKGCKLLPSTNQKSKDYITLLGDKIVSKFGKAKETSVLGVSTRSAPPRRGMQDKKAIIITKEMRYLILSNNQWGPLPVRVIISDEQNNTILSESNEEEIETLFIFPAALLKNGYKVTITNAFDEALVDTHIVIKE
ncbi:MAG: hypothetical protein JXQ76_09970 [Campylobacterales bacterium]|nr:hypothetical protein [Campylobacterales bacterium]